MNEATHSMLLVAPERCTGCGLCGMACSLQHEGVCSQALSRVKVLHREEKGWSMPVVCMQCADAPCQTVCPARAISRDAATGAYVIDRRLCIGCRLCIMVCPRGAVSFSQEGRAGHVLKCELCAGEPRCLQFGGTQALSPVRPAGLGEAARRKVLAQYGLVTVSGGADE